ncbi:putative L-aspartate dehydrogenase [Burkholderiales bacterium 8X]|nr:putative L-aspartate dehydrogenase [Burkholderiales bacterium 8X]
MNKQLRIAIIGEGAIATGLLAFLRTEASVQVVGLLTNELHRQNSAARGLLPAEAVVAQSLRELAVRPDLLVECAGHGALAEHVIPALEDGIPAVVVSTGALSDPGIADRLERAALRGGAHVHLTPGAIGGIDSLVAARLAGLSTVTYVGRKPPRAWLGTPAETAFALESLAQPTVIFRGSAREAASLYPKNANVAATVALAGLGLDETQVELVADPGITENVHAISAAGAFGAFEITLRGAPLPSNPKTSALTVYSVARAICNIARPVSL